MKKLFLNLLAILIVSLNISADCLPNESLEFQFDSGPSCDAGVWKREIRRVTFPDLYEQSIAVEGNGVCVHTQDYCCAPYYYESKCWPLYFDPVVGGGMVVARCLHRHSCYGQVTVPGLGVR